MVGSQQGPEGGICGALRSRKPLTGSIGVLPAMLEFLLSCWVAPLFQTWRGAQFCSQDSLLRICPLPCGQSAPWLCPTNPLWKNRAGKGCQAEAETAGPLDVPPLSLLAAGRPCWAPLGEGCEPAPSQHSSGRAPLALWRGPCLISQLGYRGSPPFCPTGSGLGLAQRTLGQPDSATGTTCSESQMG